MTKDRHGRDYAIAVERVRVCDAPQSRMTETAHGRVDRRDILRAADPALITLQQDAGGAIGTPLAVPALAALVRAARAARQPIARTIIVAQGDHDVEIDVCAALADDEIALALDGWTIRPPRRPWLVHDPAVRAAPPPPMPTLRWSVDGRLMLTQIDGLADLPVSAGSPMAALFRLIADDEDRMPIFNALAAHEDFHGQRAVLRTQPEREVVLDALALRGLDGRFAGFVGTASALGGPIEPSGDSGATTADFIARLDAALRPPLARIAASADQIGSQSEGPLRRDYADYAGDIGSAARHLIALVDDLADLQAIETPGFTIAPEDVDLADIARRAAGLLQVRAADRGVRIDRPAAGEACPARGDFRRVLQILVNLVGNAVRYSPPGAHVWLRAECGDGRATLVVADQGKGIATADQARIFDKFERVDPSEAEGSGLGLYISRRLARAMGGDITVDSAPGQGARFTLSLPAA